jgi:hypothetical protein
LATVYSRYDDAYWVSIDGLTTSTFAKIDARNWQLPMRWGRRYGRTRYITAVIVREKFAPAGKWSPDFGKFLRTRYPSEVSLRRRVAFEQKGSSKIPRILPF